MSARDSPLPGLLRLSPSLPFVGRSVEIAALVQLGAEAAVDGRRIAIVQGDPGSGKTRLVRQVAEQAAASGAVVLYGACDPSLSMPYQAIVEALEQLAEHDPSALAEVVDGPRGAEFAALMPDLSDRAPPPPDEGPQQDGGRFRLHTAIADALCVAAHSRPVVLVLDDIHWAGAPTLHLLRHVARATADARLLVLATARHVGADAAPDLADALAELRRQDGVARVQLGGLTTGEIQELLTRLVPGVSVPTASTLAGALADLTDGNAFLVAELGQHLTDAGLLDRPGETTATLEAIGIPEGVREVIDQRLVRMADGTREVLELVAMGPRGLELPVLREAMPGDDGALLGALDEAVSSRMLVELPGARIAYGFRHELLRRAVADRLPSPRRAALHMRVANALERAHGAEAERSVNDLALHFAAAADLGGRARAVHYGLRAAELAMRSFAYEEAARRLRAALELGIDDPLRRAHALLALGDACHRSAHASEALESYAAAAALAREHGDANVLAAAAIGFENACWRPGISDARSLTLLEQANAAVSEEDAPLRVRLLASLSRARAYRGDHRAAAALWQRAVEMARDVDDPRSLGVTLMHAIWTRGGRDPTSVLASLDEAIDLFGAIGDVDHRHEANGFRLSLLLEAFDTEALRRELPAFKREAEHSGQPFYLHVIAYMGSTLAVCDGRLADAAACAAEAFELSRQFGEGASAIHGIQRFTLEREVGRLGVIAPLIRRVVADGGDQEAWGPALALLLAELGMRDEASRELARLSADDLAAVPRGGLRLAGLVYLADTCALVGDAAVAELLYGELLGLAGTNLVIGQAVACYGAADRHLGVLAAILGDLRAAEDHFEAALELNGRMRSPTWLAHTRYEYARALRRRGAPADLARADQLLAQALEAARQIGLRALAGRAEREGAAVTELPDSLSAREVQVLRLIASGQSNREIGESLQISQHTAANHVRSILLKTRCANRTEAAAYAYKHQLVTR